MILLKRWRPHSAQATSGHVLALVLMLLLSEVAFAPSTPQPALAEEAYWKTLWEASRSMPSPHADLLQGIFMQLASSQSHVQDGGRLPGGRSEWLMLEFVLLCAQERP